MPLRPTYLDDDTVKQLDDARGQQLLDDAISGIRAPSVLDQAIKGIRRRAYGDEDATSWKPLPIVVSDRPDARLIAQQQQAQAQPSARAQFSARSTAPETPETPSVPTFRAEDFSHEDGQSTYTPLEKPAAASGTPAQPASDQQVAATPSGADPSTVARIANAGTRASRYAEPIARIAAEQGVPADVLAALVDTEDSDEGSTSVDGARGLLQVVPGQGFDQPGENASDPETSIRQGARALKEKIRMAGGDTRRAGGLYFGVGTDSLGNTTSTYQQKFDANRARYGATPTAAAPSAAGSLSQAPAAAAPSQSSAAGASRPTQFAEGLSWSEAIAACGLAGVAWFTAKTGRTPATVAEVKQAAQATQAWDADSGMHGAEATAGLMRQYGIAAHVEDGVDWAKIRADVQRGNPVLFDTNAGSNGHYYGVEAARQRPDGVWEYDLGTSATDLKAAQGRRWFTADEIPNLGFGTPYKTIYADNPQTPAPSVVAGQSQYKLSDTQIDDDTGGLSAGDQKRAKLADQGGTMYRQPLLPTDPEASTGAEYDPRDADQGAHEAGYTNGGFPDPSGDGTSAPGVAVPSSSPSPDRPSPADDPGGAQFAAQDAYSTPVAPQQPYNPFGGSPDPVADATRSVQPDTPPTSPTSTQVPVWDDSGQVIGYRQAPAPAQRQNQQRQADGYGTVSSTPGEPDYVPSPPNRVQGVADTVATEGIATPIGRGIANAVTRPLLGKPPLPDSGQPETSIDRAIVETGRSLGSNINAAREGYQSGDTLQTGMGALGVVGDLAPSTTLARQLNELLPRADTPLGEIGAGDVVMTAALAYDAARLGYGAIKAGGRIGSKIAQAISESVPAERFSAWMAQNAENVARADARMAEQGSTVAGGTLGVVTGNPLEASTAASSRVIPPHVSDTLDFPVRVPTDPSVVRAIEAAGGSVDPDRGVNLNVIRNQDPEAHGQVAARGGPFYIAGSPGTPNPYARGAGAGHGTGGSDRIEAPTTYRSPMILSAAPGEKAGFDDGMRQLGLLTHENDNWRGLPMANAGPSFDEVTRQLKAIYSRTPPGSPERFQAARDLVSKYGGDPNLVEPLMRLRGPDHEETYYGIRENILAHNARAKGYDGVLTVQGSMAPHEYQDALEMAVSNHPDYKKAGEESYAIRKEIDALERQRSEVSWSGGDVDREYARIDNAIDDAHARWEDAKVNLEKVHDRLIDQVHVENPGKITELADFRESHNPTPAPPTPELKAAHATLQEAQAAQEAAFDALTAKYGKAIAQTPEDFAILAERQAAVARAEGVIHGMSGPGASSGPPGYTLRSDLPARQRPFAELERAYKAAQERGRTAATDAEGQAAQREMDALRQPLMDALRREQPQRLPGAPETASATAGVLPGGSRGAGALNAVTQEAGRVVAGGVGGATLGAGAPADTPEERRRNMLIGAGLGMVAGPLLSRRVRGEGGALATFGTSPNYRPPTPQRIQQAAAQGERRGAMLNRAVTAPDSAVPRRVSEVVRTTDDRAAMRWAEDMLSDAAGKPRMRENDPARPSTQSRVNAGSVANERISNELEQPVIDAAQAGLQRDLPRFLEDMHHRDVLNGFYDRGYQALMDRRQPAIDAAKARGVSPVVIQRMEAKAAADADAAGTATMRTRQGSNPEHTFEATDARLQEQEQRLQGDGRWQQLQDAAQGVWDHNAATRQRLVDSGNMDAQTAADLTAKYPHYVPTVPISHLTEGGGPVASSSTAVSRGTKPSISALEDVGTSGERLNPIVASRNSTVKAEREIQRNNVARAFARMMDDAQVVTPATTATTKATHRTFLGGGVDVHYREMGDLVTLSVPKQIADGLEAAAQMGMQGDSAGRIWRTAMGTVTSAMTAGRASFLPVNLQRDVQDYAIRTASKEGGPQHLPGVMGTWITEAGKAVADIARAQVTGRGMIGAALGAGAGAVQGNENTTIGERARHAVEGAVAGTFLIGANKVRATGKAAEYLSRGGGSGGASANWKVGQRWYRDVLADGGAPIKSAGDAAKYLGDWLQDVATLQGVKGINERTELISRTAAMTRADKQGMAPVEAMTRGRDASYDPDRSGTLARTLNGWVPFFNASVQNSAQFTRLLKQNPVAAAATLTATVAPIMLATEAWNRSDPTRAQVYDDIPQYVKDSGIVTVLPWAGSDNRGERPNYLWIPTGVQTPFVMGMREAMEKLPGLEPVAGRDGDWAETLGSVLGMFSPVRGDSVGAAMSNLIPQGIKQGVELAVNRDFYRGNPIETGPADERASAASQKISEGANAVGRTVGNDWLQEVRPSGVEHVVRSLPAYGDIVTGASDMVAPSGYKRAEDRPIANEPFVGGIGNRFIRDTGGANLQRAQDAHIPEAIRPVLQEADMRPSDIGTVPSRYRGATITRDEQRRWQESTNVYLTEMVYTARDSAAWDDPLKRKAEVQKAMTKARDLAARDVFDLTDADIRDRMDRERSMKAK